MEIVFEILIVILPAIITGLFTTFITKYKYNKNIPLDKMEIAYNRVYYPLYIIISDKNLGENVDEVINKGKIYLVKYNKYVDVSTKRLFDKLYNCNKETEKKSIFQNFKNNIYSRHSYLRRRLGYLEPNFIQSYTYSTPAEKSLIRIFMDLCIIYISIMICGISINRFNTIFRFSIAIFSILILWILCELIWCFLRFLYYRIRK